MVIAMKEEIYNKIKDIFEKNNKYARTQDILDANIHSSHLYKLVDRGEVTRLKRGLYRWNDVEYDTDREMVEVQRIVPDGVFSLLSALSYYELTTYNPWEYYLAIHRDHFKPSLPDYPPISIYYFADKQYYTGITEISIKGEKVKIYDQEKTICDCIRFRKKIGVDVMKEALQKYLKQDYRDIDKLLNYAEITGVKTLMNKYLQVLA